MGKKLKYGCIVFVCLLLSLFAASAVLADPPRLSGVPVTVGHELSIRDLAATTPGNDTGLWLGNFTLNAAARPAAIYSSSTSEPLYFNSNINLAGVTTGFVFDTAQAFVAGDFILSLRNAGTPQLTLDYAGNLALLGTVDGYDISVNGLNWDIAFGWGDHAVAGYLTSTLASASIFVGNVANVATGVAMTGDVGINNAGLTTIQANSVALTTDTDGSYVASVATSAPLSGGATGSEGAALTLGVTANAIDFTELSNTLSLDADTSIAAGAGEEVTYNKAFTNATGENGFVLNFTPSDTTSSTTAQYGLYLDNIASTEGADALLVLDNSDIDDAVGAAIKITDAGGGFTSIIDNAGTLISGAELNTLDGVTSALQTQMDLKAPLASPTFTGTVTIPTPFTLGAVSVLPTGTELNFVDGVTSAIQTQIDGKQPLDAGLTDIAGLAVTDSNFIVGDGTNWVAETGATARISLGLGSIATQAANNVAITGGAIDNTTIGSTTQTTGKFTTLSVLEGGAAPTFFTTFQGGDQAGAITYTLPTALGAAGTALTDAAGTGALSWATAGAGDITTVGSCTTGDCFIDGVNHTLTFEGATADTVESILGAADPTIGDQTFNLPNMAALGTYTLATTATAFAGDVTGNIGATTIAADSVALTTDTTGNYVGDVATGSGVTATGAAGEGYTETVALGNLTADWTQAGAFDIALANTASELKIMEGGVTPSLYGIFDVGDLTTADKTYTFPDVTGDVTILGQTIGTAEVEAGITLDTEWDTWVEHPALTSANILVGNGSNQAAGVAMSGDVAISNAGLTTIQADSVALTTDTAGNYVASVGTTAPLSGGAAGSEGPALTLSIAADGINFTELSDTLALDASTSITADGIEVLSLTNTGTGNSFLVEDAASDTTPFVIDAAGLVGIGIASPATALHVAPSTGLTLGEDKAALTSNVAGTMKLISVGDNALSSTFTTGTQTQDVAYTLPLDDGTDGQVLSTNGTGTLSWATSGGGFASGAKAFRQTTEQTIPSDAVTKIQFNGESYDGLGEFDSTTNYRFTAQAAGYYLVTSCVTWNPFSDAGRMTIRIVVNAVAYAVHYESSGATTVQGSTITDIVYLTAGQYIEIDVYQTSGANRSVDPGSTATYVSIRRLY